MYKISQIVSKPVFCLYEGIKLGTVKNFIYNNKTRCVEKLILFDDDSENIDNVLKINDIYLLSDSAILVRNGEKVSQDFIEPNQIINLQVLSVKGEDVGKINDIILDDNLVAISFETTMGISIPAQDIVKIGQDVVFFDSNEKKIKTYYMKPRSKLFGPVPEVTVKILGEIPSIEKVEKAKPLSIPSRVIANPNKLIGKTAVQNVLGISGELVIRAGQVVTQKILEKAKKHSKLFELTNSVM